jgi:cell division transport system permease protein
MTTLERAWRAGKSEWRTHLTSVLGTSVAFLCLAFALISTVNLRELERRWEHTGRLSIYISLTATPEQIADLREALRQSEGVALAEFVPAERARDELLQSQSTSLLESLPIEAFPPSIEVTLDENARAARGEAIAALVARMPAVESVETYTDWTRKIGELVRAVSVLSWALAALVFLSVVAVVASTTRLSLHRRKEEVEVLRYVGATSNYVRGPFLVEGAAQGALGAGTALVASAVCFWVLRGSFAEQFLLLTGARPSYLPWSYCVALVAMGTLLGTIAAHASLWRSFRS